VTGPTLTEPLVSIGLPVRNGARLLPAVLQSALAQDYPDLEVVVCDNASTDDTEQVCRQAARADPRIVYHRHRTDVGLLNNFVATMRLARGDFFRWIGDGDTLDPTFVSRCLAAFHQDERRVLVTTQIGYVGPGRVTATARYDGTGLASPDPLTRFNEILRLLNESYLLIDPLYGLMRRATIAALPRVNGYREDQLLAVRLALAGPWGHVPDVLAWRRRDPETVGAVARKLGVPRWQVHLSTALLCRDLWRLVEHSDLDPTSRHRARVTVARFYARRHRRIAARRGWRLASYVGLTRTHHRRARPAAPPASDLHLTEPSAGEPPPR
jgi:glycosyltransferase involved in cell wall biosynthesis